MVGPIACEARKRQAEMLRQSADFTFEILMLNGQFISKNVKNKKRYCSKKSSNTKLKDFVNKNVTTPATRRGKKPR